MVQAGDGQETTMAKAVRFFVGTLSNGVSTEAAMREDGTLFVRYYEFNGYAKAWTKWSVLNNPVWETHGTNVYSGERVEYAKPQLACGFRMYNEIPAEGIRVRLPN